MKTRVKKVEYWVQGTAYWIVQVDAGDWWATVWDSTEDCHLEFESESEAVNFQMALESRLQEDQNNG